MARSAAIHWIRPGDPPDAFPEPERALRRPNGLLAAGGDLSPERLLAAYRRGIFPWYENDQPVLWWSPDPRAVLPPAELRISRSLRKVVRAGRFSITMDRDFAAVVDACAEPRRGQPGTWITQDMGRAYRRLHQLGYAHSAEAHRDGELAGGVYGIGLGRVYFGESMFSRRRDASKVALVYLASALVQRRFELIDCQIDSAHLASLGSRRIPRRRFLALLDALCEPAQPTSWRDYRAPDDPDEVLAVLDDARDTNHGASSSGRGRARRGRPAG